MSSYDGEIVVLSSGAGAIAYRKVVHSAGSVTYGRKYYYDYIEVWYVPVGATPPQISHPRALEKRGILTYYVGRHPSGSIGPRSHYASIIRPRLKKYPDIVIGTPGEVDAYLGAVE